MRVLLSEYFRVFLPAISFVPLFWNIFKILVTLILKKKKNLKWCVLITWKLWIREVDLLVRGNILSLAGIWVEIQNNLIWLQTLFPCTCARYTVALNKCCWPYATWPKERLRNWPGLKGRHSWPMASTHSTLSFICSFWQYIPLSYGTCSEPLLPCPTPPDS